MYRFLLVVSIALLGLLLVFAGTYGATPPASASIQSEDLARVRPHGIQARLAQAQAVTPTLQPTQMLTDTITSTVTATVTTTLTVSPTVAAAGGTPVPTSKPGTFGQAEVNQIFPPGRGQDLIFRACVNCHNWVPIALAQMTPEDWQRNAMTHRNRVSGLTDEEFNFLYQYLQTNFAPNHQPPDNIPQDLLQEWTSY